MSAEQQKESQNMKFTGAANIVWFEIPADDVQRAKTFYGELFGWKMEKFPGPMEYWLSTPADRMLRQTAAC